MEQKIVVENKANGVRATVVVRDGKWIDEKSGKEWSDKLRRAYSKVEEVKPVVATPEAKSAFNRSTENVNNDEKTAV